MSLAKLIISLSFFITNFAFAESAFISCNIDDQTTSVNKLIVIKFDYSAIPNRVTKLSIVKTVGQLKVLKIKKGREVYTTIGENIPLSIEINKNKIIKSTFLDLGIKGQLHTKISSFELPDGSIVTSNLKDSDYTYPKGILASCRIAVSKQPSVTGSN